MVTIEVSRKQCPVGRAEVKIHRLSFVPLQHLAALKYSDTGSFPTARPLVVAQKLVDRQIVTIRPDSQLGIVVEIV